RRPLRPAVEVLEARWLPSNVTIAINDNRDVLDNPATVTAGTLGSTITLRDALNAANNSSASDRYTIQLQAGTTYTLDTVDNYWYGPDGLPAISSSVILDGQGATLVRDSSGPAFRFFYVSGGMELAAGSLTLENLTLQGGLAQGGSGMG